MAEQTLPWLIAATLLALAPGVGRAAVQAAELRLTVPDARAPEPFSLVKGIRELSDHRVLITDWIEERLVVVDFDRNTVRDLGRIGGGPMEFRLPERLLAFSGDTTLLVDVGNGRFAVIAPSLEFVRTIPMYAHGEAYAMSPRGSDDHAALYFQPSPFAFGTGPPRDSVPIGRWSENASGVVFVGDGVLLRAYTPRPPGVHSRPGLPYVAFAKQDDWAASSDGWVAVVRSTPYRVEWYGPGGQVIVGPPVSYEPRRVTLDDRRREVRDFMRGSYMSGRGEGGGAGHVPAELQSDREIDRMAREDNFEEAFPPFQGGSVWATARHVWVQRAGPPTEPTTLDVFDRASRRIASVLLPASRRVIGFGAGTVYTTVVGADDLLTLERYRLPALPH